MPGLPAPSAVFHRAPGDPSAPGPAAEASRAAGGLVAVEAPQPEADRPSSADPVLRRQRRRLALAGVPGHVAKGRTFTRQALQDWGWDSTETSEDTLLIVSELLTNASLHADGCHELVLTADETALRVEVHDGTTVLPVPHPAPHRGIPGGRGLYIVERLSDRWDTHVYGTGKAVWAEIEATRLDDSTTATP
ncbi:ATP-binding protein [Streptomyces venezuelae]|uniref:ATP-binding protein n=1 Tax=Streptomyces venezuelae TaxID=54571 RepID=UPI003317C996